MHGAKSFSRILAAGSLGSLISRLLRILGIGRWLRRIWILLNLIPFQRLLRALRLFILELLECGHGLLGVFHAVKAAVDNSELIPCLLQNIWIGIGFCRSLEMLSRSSIIAKQHFGAAQIVVRIAKAWPN